eukprot:CAMPEP_0197038064 /NCGR_PEP_ID=MMETSP1384-20130603/15101_1 /TAXON_ID=29189 /ORGANISM="Ammonia sp." /LENGTH=583 /DNA_ID=CAMNT_0042468457 /DNA_START=112 /DNA_END=1863 /DNA_ORIENTATION=-
MNAPPSSPRRSARLRNKNAASSQLMGDRRYIFTHNFSETNETSSQSNQTKMESEPTVHPTISRCKRQLQFVHHNPNVFIIENFLTQKEIDHLLDICKRNANKFETSYTQATSHDQHYSNERTSTFIFLQKYMDKISRAIETRAADIVSMPVANVEPLQLVRYTDGQEFTLHHDAGTLINETNKKSSSSSLWSVNSMHSQQSQRSHASNQSNVSYSMNSNASHASMQSDGAYSMDLIYNTQHFMHRSTNTNSKHNNNNPVNLRCHSHSHQSTAIHSAPINRNLTMNAMSMNHWFGHNSNHTNIQHNECQTANTVASNINNHNHNHNGPPMPGNTTNVQQTALPQQSLTSAQYAMFYQQWLQNMQHLTQEMLVAQQQRTQIQQMQQLQSMAANVQKAQSLNTDHSIAPHEARRPQSCPPQLAVFRLHASGKHTPHHHHQHTHGKTDGYDRADGNTDSAIKEEKRMEQDEDDEEDDADGGNLSKEEHAEKYDEYSVEMVKPVRLCSFFVYLTTLPEGSGGETYFPKLDLKVRPERGKAILWCNVEAENTAKADPMVIHRAMPVEGDHEKIGMNIWINATQVDAEYH